MGFGAVRPRRSVGSMGFLGVEGVVRDTSKYILIQIYGVSTASHGDRKGDWKYWGQLALDVERLDL